MQCAWMFVRNRQMEGQPFAMIGQVARQRVQISSAVQTARRLGLLRQLSDVAFEGTQFLRTVCVGRFN